MLPLDDALSLIKKSVPAVLETDTVSPADALGRICAEDIAAPYALPPFTNTGVDGYAFQHGEGVTTFELAGASFAGEPFSGTLKKGQAARIATGALLPDGADTVVMQEVCTVQDGMLYIRELPNKGSNLRHRGGDINTGDTALQAQTVLRPQEIALATALGISQMTVTRKLKIAIASTGLELLQPGQAPNPGKIVDTNTLMLHQTLSGPAIEVTKLPFLPDDYDATKTALKATADHHDIVLTTGGVSVGDRDFVRDVLHDEGEILFWKVAIRPGKPVIVGRIGSSTMIGLPGNPVSALVTCHLVVRAVCHALWGSNVSLPDGFMVPLADEITKPQALRAFPRARFTNGKAHPYSDQSSNLYTSLTNADGLIDLPEGRSVFERGEQVLFRPFNVFW